MTPAWPAAFGNRFLPADADSPRDRSPPSQGGGRGGRVTWFAECSFQCYAACVEKHRTSNFQRRTSNPDQVRRWAFNVRCSTLTAQHPADYLKASVICKPHRLTSQPPLVKGRRTGYPAKKSGPFARNFCRKGVLCARNVRFLPGAALRFSSICNLENFAEFGIVKMQCDVFN